MFWLSPRDAHQAFIAEISDTIWVWFRGNDTIVEVSSAATNFAFRLLVFGRDPRLQITDYEN